MFEIGDIVEIVEARYEPARGLIGRVIKITDHNHAPSVYIDAGKYNFIVAKASSVRTILPVYPS